MDGLRFGGSAWCNIDIALRNLDAIYNRELEPLGLVIIESYILRLLYEQDGQMPSRLAQGVGRPATSFTPILDKLQNKRLIERHSHPADRRAVKIYLTAYGKGLEAEVKASTERIESRMRQQFADKDWQGFQRITTDFQSIAP
ncbi:MAG: MarR family transcriptional regulator [Anaerolineae bacterium]|nr:MarR family transcriptional regulator [Anaerolineae bacterium]